MADSATPNLPSRDFTATAEFHAALGFVETFRDIGWMILVSGDLTLEFFPHPTLDPSSSWFSCCFRLDDVHAFHAIATGAGVPEKNVGCPRVHRPRLEPWGGIVGALIDPDGTLVRLIQAP